MDISLEKIDIIRERTGISYKDAKELLEKHEGNVVEALIDFENNQKSWSDNVSGKGAEVIDKLKEAVRKGNVTRILLRKDGDVILNIPVTAGAIGAVISPPFTALGITTALIAGCELEIVKENGEVVNVNDMAEKTVDKVKKSTKMDNGGGQTSSNPNDVDEEI